MVIRYQLSDGALVSSESEESAAQVYIDPDTKEREALRASLNINEHTLSSVLDPDEVSRLEVNADQLLVIWKRPENYSGGESFFFNVESIGMFLLKNRLVVVVKEDIELTEMSSRFQSTWRSPLDVMLGVLFGTINHFTEHLKAIQMIARDLQEKINTSMENKHLIQMFNLSESLVYYLNAISSNGVVLTRLRTYGEKAGFSLDTIGLIDDLLIENNQCFKQAEIYSTVFSGLMDARGSLVNNNMNLLLRNLTVINIVFLPLNLIAGIGGMSEFSMMTHGVDWRISYGLFLVSMFFLGWLTAVMLRKLNFGSGLVRIPRPTRKRRKAAETRRRPTPPVPVKSGPADI